MISSASAVVSHMAGSPTFSDFPQVRPPGQLYVQFTLESPAYIPIRGVDDIINVTMTYRRDSYIFVPVTYSEILDQPKSGR